MITGFNPLWSILGVFILIGFIFTVNTVYNPMVSGTRRWATYTGTLLSFDIDCSQCCHASSGFSINTSEGVVHEHVIECDECLEHLVNIGQVYTIRIEPFAEPYAITVKFGEPSSYWDVSIDWIKDSSGRVIYGNEWI